MSMKFFKQFASPDGIYIKFRVQVFMLKETSEYLGRKTPQLPENYYWQYSCGCEHFQHEFPLDPTTLANWRKRLGPKGVGKGRKSTSFFAAISVRISTVSTAASTFAKCSPGLL